MGFFAENLEASYKAALQTGVFSYPARGEVRTPWITRKDIAEGVVVAALNWDLHGVEYNLNGVAAVSFDETVALLSKISGKTVPPFVLYHVDSIDRLQASVDRGLCEGVGA